MQRASAGENLFAPSRFLEYCHDLGAGGIQAPLGVLADDEAEALAAQADRWGMFIEGSVSPPFKDSELDRFEAQIRSAARAGARSVRTVILPGRRYERFTSWEEFLRFCDRGAQAVRRAAPIVERHRVQLAIENHKDQRLEMRLPLLEEISSEYVGACVDTGNSFALLEDPTEVVEAFAPWAVSVHLKDQAVRENEDGFWFADVALGEGFLNLPKMVRVLQQAKPGIHFSLETITRDPLTVPCLTDRYWTVMQDAGGPDLARTLRVVREHESDSLQQVSGLSLEDQVAVESANVRRSLDYARQRLGL